MVDIVKRALHATRESKHIEFKRGFDPASPGEWCEIVKDIVALANSGGGVVVFGLDSTGQPTGESVEHIAREDPANLLNRLARYIETPSFEIESVELKKRGQKLHAFIISGTPIPHVFQKPGTYDIGAGKQKAAFSVGTIYFRHGAKSEHGNSDDLRAAIERQLKLVRKAWVNGVRRVVQAPADSEIIAVQRTSGPIPAERSVRAVKDSNAQPVFLTRKSDTVGAIFYHEEISDGIFDEINNVIDANRVLARGQKRFFFGQAIYHRIYAERQHVVQQRENLELLLHASISEFYAPGLFWMLSLPDEVIAAAYVDLYRSPRGPQIHSLIRIAPVLGDEFCKWLLERLSSKWGKHTQPPNFYWAYKNMVERSSSIDYRLIAARLSLKSRASLGANENVGVSELLADPARAAAILSVACMVAFEGRDGGESRSIARNLDYLAYGAEIRKRAKGISDSIIRAVGSQQVGELIDSADDE